MRGYFSKPTVEGLAPKHYASWTDAYKWHAAQVAAVAVELHAETARTIEDQETMLDELWRVCETMEESCGRHVDDLMRVNIWKRFYYYGEGYDCSPLADILDL